MTTPERRRCWCGIQAAGRASLLLLFSLIPLAGPVTASSQSKRPEKPYALIYGTVYGPDDHTVYGVKVHIRRSDQKRPKWELYSDHAGEFAQRVPAGHATYVIWADLKGYKPMNGKKLEAGQPVTLEIQNDERADISVHLK